MLRQVDAMDCQTKIAICIRHGEADCLLSLKGNHGTLRAEVRDLFADPSARGAAQTAGNVVGRASSQDKGHGRIEERHLTVTDHIEWMDAKERRAWLKLRSLVHLRSVRVMADGSRSEKDRYWLTSLEWDAQKQVELSCDQWHRKPMPLDHGCDVWRGRLVDLQRPRRP